MILYAVSYQEHKSMTQSYYAELSKCQNDHQVCNIDESPTAVFSCFTVVLSAS